MADPKIRFDILANAQGAGEVSQLANELEKLDGSLDPALAARAKETAAQLREVGRQEGAINAFRQLKTASAEAARALEQAQGQAQALGREISAADTPTRTQAAQMDKLRAAVRSAKDAHTESVQKLQEHRLAMADAGVSTKNLADQQVALSAKQRSLKGEAADISQSYREQASTAAVSANTQVHAAGRVTVGLKEVGDSANSAAGMVRNMGAALAAGFTFERLVQAAAQMETVKVGLVAVTGSTEAARQEFDFIRQTATRVGADIGEVGQAFLGLAAATKGTAVEGEPTRQVFEAVATAMGKAGKSSAETQNALVALAQIASKGTVSMEELRGQLGEALPGALQATANGLGITTKDLIGLVETGQLAAEDLFPALSKGLADLYGGGAAGAQTLTQEITNIKNQFVELANSLGENGGLDALKVGAEIAQMALVLLDDTLVRTGKTIGVLAAAVATMDFSQLPEAFAEIEKEGRDKLLRAAEHNSVLRRALSATGDEALQTALKQREAAKAAKDSGDEAQKAGGGYVALATSYGKVTAEVEKQIAAADKSRIAREAEGKAATALAQAFGTEAEKRMATAQAAQADAAALAEIARLRQTNVEVLKAELAAKLEYIQKNSADSEQRQKEIKELKERIDLRQTEADKAIAQARAGHLAAAAAQAEAEATADNSGRVKELADAYKVATDTLETLRAAKAAGKDVTDDLAAAEIEAGRAARLYRDALSDQANAIKSASESKQAALSLQQQATRLAIEEQRAIHEIAVARGDEYTATRAQNEIKRLEIELLQLTAEAKRAEAMAQLAVVEAKRAELEASNQLTPAKKAELDASIAKAKAMETEAKIADLTANKLKELAQITGGTGSASLSASGAADRLSGSLDHVGNSAEKARSKVERLGNSVSNVGQLTADGFKTNADGSAAGGFNNNMPIDKAFAVKAAVETGNYAGLTLADAQAAYRQAMDAKNWMDSALKLNAGAFSLQARADTNALAVAAQTALERLGGSTSGSGAAGMSKTVTVKVDLNGRKSTIDTASQADADSLTSMLRQLESNMARTA